MHFLTEYKRYNWRFYCIWILYNRIK